MKLEIRLLDVLMAFTLIVWLGALYMRWIIRPLKKEIAAADDLAYLGISRCANADKNFNALRIFYKIVVFSLIFLIVGFVIDEAARLFFFFKNTAVRDKTISQMLFDLVNVNFLLGLLAGCGCWCMVRDVHEYGSDVIKKCNELKEREMNRI